jgi:hypothetical protein
MTALAEERCFNHALRQAGARCPSCRRYFCRECVTEHHDRLLCAECLALAMAPAAAPQRRSWAGRVLLPLQCVGSLLLLWSIFFFVGKLLVVLPNEFHVLDPLDVPAMEDS